MSTYLEDRKKITIQDIKGMKVRGEKISMLTAYDYTMARIVDQAGVDIVLVGDSASNVMAGNKTTLPITLEQMIYHGQSVVKGVNRAFTSIDMPFGSCSGNPEKSLEAAIRMIKETGIDSVKIEGGKEIIADIRKIIDAGIPVMGHLGLMPQSINRYGSYGVRAKDNDEAEKLLNDARLLESAGCYALLLEKIPAKLAETVSNEINIPTIGIGAGPGTDGQVLVIYDMLGMNKEFSPKFLRRYADLDSVITQAVQSYTADVKNNSFPNENESY